MLIFSIGLFVVCGISFLVFLWQKSRFVRLLDAWKERPGEEKPHVDIFGRAKTMLFPPLVVLVLTFLAGWVTLLIWMI